MLGTKYSIPQFIEDSRKIVAGSQPLEAKKKAIGEHLSELSKRPDLMRFGLPFGPSDAGTGGYLLWREPPSTVLVIGEWLPGYMSPVHEHRDFWVVACGYRGRDQWDMYERLDDGSKPGFAEVKLVDQWEVTPGRVVFMPPPPRAVHSHNNLGDGMCRELIFSVNPPPGPNERLVYDVEGKACWPSGGNFAPVYSGDYFPPRMTQNAALSLKHNVKLLRDTVKQHIARGARNVLEAPLFRHKPAFCPICMSFV